jgi:hypothetical protein
MVIHVFALLVQPHAAVKQFARAIGLLPRLAAPGMTLDTGQALAATRCKHQRDVIANLEIADARAHFLNDAGSFVAEHHGHLPRPVAIDRG